MRVTRRQRRMMFQVCVLLYFAVNFILREKYEEKVGNIVPFDNTFLVERSWGEYLQLVGWAFLPEFLAQILELLSCAVRPLIKMIIGITRTMVGGAGMMVTGVMLARVVLGLHNVDTVEAILLAGLCGAMVIYGILTGIAAMQNEKKMIQRLFEDEVLEI